MSVANVKMKTVARLALGTALVTVLSGCESRFGRAFTSMVSPQSQTAEPTLVYQPTPAPGNPTYVEGSRAANLQTFESIYGAPVTGPSSTAQQNASAYSIPSFNDGAVAIAPLSAPVETSGYSVAAIPASTVTETIGVTSVAGDGLTYGDTLTSSAYQLDAVTTAQPVYESDQTATVPTETYAALEPAFTPDVISGGTDSTGYTLPTVETVAVTDPMPIADTLMAPASSYIEPISTFDSQIESYDVQQPVFGEQVMIEPTMAKPAMIEPTIVESAASTIVYDQPALDTTVEASIFDEPALEAESLGGQYGVVTSEALAAPASTEAAGSAETMWQSLVDADESVLPAPSASISGVTIMPVSEVMETMTYETTAGSEITITPTPRAKATAEPEPMVMAALAPAPEVMAVAAPVDLGPAYAPAPRARPSRMAKQAASYTTVALAPAPQPRPDFERPVTIATSAGIMVEETLPTPVTEPVAEITTIDPAPEPVQPAEVQIAAVAPEPVSVASTIRADDSDLSGTSWRLVSVAGTEVSSNAELHFDGNSGFAGGQGPCNSYGGEYSTAKMGTFGMANIFTTSLECPNLEIEKSYIEALENAGEYVIAPGFAELELRNAAGEILVKFKAF